MTTVTKTKVEVLGHWWSDSDIPIVKIDDKLIALYGWNGELYTECWKVIDFKDNKGWVAGEDTWCAKPIYNGNEIVGYDLYK